MTSLTSISKALDSMSAATKAYDSGVIKFIAIKQAEDGLMAQIQTATKQLAKSPPLATADNAAVAGEMGEVLPKVGGVAKAIASKVCCVYTWAGSALPWAPWLGFDGNWGLGWSIN